VIEKGKIVEEGNWESLMELQGIFYEMVQRQLFLKEPVNESV
jgi:ABC-type multidrug transport system fused ATPase/permease subunit